MSDFKYTFNLDTTATGDGAEKTKAGIDAVTQSTNQATEAQVKASGEVAEAFKEEFAALDALKAKAAERSDETKNTVAETDAYIEQMEALVDAVNRYNEALAAGDQEATIEALDDIKVGMDAVAASSDEIPPELEEINAELDELDKKVRGKKSFEKLSDQANGTSKSLKRIEKLQVAEAIGNIVSQARSAGKSFADLGKEGESATDTALNAAGAVGDLASGVAAGFAAGGPIGAGIALVTAGLSYFSAQAKKTRAEIDKAFGGEINLDFKQTEQSIKDTEDAAKAYADQIDRANASLVSQQNRLENIRQLELQKARDKATLENKELDLKKLDIIGSDLGEKEKAGQLAEITKQQIQNEADFKKKELESGIAKDRKDIESLRTTIIKLEQQVNDKSKNLITDNVANGNEAESLKNEASKQGDRFENAAKDIPELLASSVTNPFYDEAHQDELEKYVKEINEQKSTDDPKLRAESFQRLKRILESAPQGDLDGDDKKLLEGINKALQEYSAFQKINSRASESKKESDVYLENLETTRKQLEGAKQNFDDRDEAIEGRISSGEGRLETLEKETVLDKKTVDKTTDNKVKQIEKREAQKAAQEEKKREREAAKKQKAIDKKEAKAGKSVGTALDTVRGLPLTGKKFKKRVNEAINANADGADNSEMEEVLAIIREAAASGKASGAVGAAMRAELGRLHGAIKANNKTLNQQVQDLAKFKQLYLNNRR